MMKPLLSSCVLLLLAMAEGSPKVPKDSRNSPHPKSQKHAKARPCSFSRVGDGCQMPEEVNKCFVCHFSDNDDVQKLSVGCPAISAHIRHGDALPGGFGADGVRYDCDCNAEDPTEQPCQDDECCEQHPLVNQDPTLGAHFDKNCPTMIGDRSLVGCVEFTGCRYVVEQCDDDACCEANPLRNPSLDVVFDDDCPAQDGDQSLVGCIEFTKCRYTDSQTPPDSPKTPKTTKSSHTRSRSKTPNISHTHSTKTHRHSHSHSDSRTPKTPSPPSRDAPSEVSPTPNGACVDDMCCSTHPLVNGQSILGIHFDPDCPTQEGDLSQVGCVEFTGCRYGSDFENPCNDSNCCKANPLVNQAQELAAFFDPNCPTDDGDRSLVGCVEFTGCRYVTDVCDDDECCAANPLINQDLGAHFDDSCPKEDGQLSLIGCVEFTGCRINSDPDSCTSDKCCQSNPLVSLDPSLGVHFNDSCPSNPNEPSLVGCVEFTQCQYFTTVCEEDSCCLANPLVQPDDDLGAHFYEGCPKDKSDAIAIGCVDFTQCRYGDETFFKVRSENRRLDDGSSQGLSGGVIAAIVISCILVAILASVLTYYYFQKRSQKVYQEYVAMQDDNKSIDIPQTV